MFGRNTPVGPVEKDLYQVHEIFVTIQGEGPFAGLPAVFVRLTGCNLRCYFCDTEWDDEGDPFMTAREIAEKCVEIAGSASLVVLTGGEPARQALGPLIDELRGFFCRMKVQIETAGTYWQDCFTEDGVTVVISPKTSRVHANFTKWQSDWHWKYVIDSETLGIDGFPTAPTQRHIRDDDKRNGGKPFVPDVVANLYFQPMDVYDEEKNKANIRATVKAAQITGGRAQLQLHKIFDLP